MADNSVQPEQFTGLVLLTGEDAPGIAGSLFQTLAPFAVHVLDVEQVINNNRLILTVLLAANPVHQKAIEEDLNICAVSLGVDIAAVFSKNVLPNLPKNQVTLSLRAKKLHPQIIADLCVLLAKEGANIEHIRKTADEPVSLLFEMSGCALTDIENLVSTLTLNDEVTILVGE